MKDIYSCGYIPIRTYHIGTIEEIKNREERLKDIYGDRATYKWGRIYLPMSLTDYDGELCCDTQSKEGYGLTVESFSRVYYFFLDE